MDYNLYGFVQFIDINEIDFLLSRDIVDGLISVEYIDEVTEDNLYEDSNYKIVLDNNIYHSFFNDEDRKLFIEECINLSIIENIKQVEKCLTN